MARYNEDKNITVNDNVNEQQKNITVNDDMDEWLKKHEPIEHDGSFVPISEVKRLLLLMKSETRDAVVKLISLASDECKCGHDKYDHEDEAGEDTSCMECGCMGYEQKLMQ